MRIVILLPVVSLIALLLHAGCASTPSAESHTASGANASSGVAEAPRTTAGRRPVNEVPPRPALINHFVTFKLHDPADVDELIADCDRYLARIPGVVSYFAGRHHDIGRGDRVFTDYHVGFFVGFNSDADYRAYVDHPDHVMVVQKWQDRLERLRVYDVFDDGKRHQPLAASGDQAN